MSNPQLISLAKINPHRRPIGAGGGIILIKPPYFSPWTPPLGIAILKSFLEGRGYTVRCHDFNTDSELWGMHHKYFAMLRTLSDVSINDGYSKLWSILNAHMLAYANGASASDCLKVIETVTPLYGIRCNRKMSDTLVPLVEKFFQRLAEQIDHLDLTQFSVVGTSTYTTSLAASLFILRRIKQHRPQITTVMGGGVFADDLALGSENLETLIREYDYVNHIVLGEGELLFLKLLQGDLADRRVISLADLGGETLKMEDVPPPDFSEFERDNYFHLTVEGARSCPFQCSFCSETVQWGEYRKKPMDLFARQVGELAAKYGNKSFFMGDSLMNPYIKQFSSELLKQKANILYDGYLRADKPVTYDSNVRQWARSGCYRVRLGIESAAARVLESMDKMTTPTVISDVLKSLSAAGIRTTTYWIVGFPGETEQDFLETCDFVREHHRYIYELEAHPYYYYPYGQIGSRLYQCSSLYPDEITRIIKFKTWDIINATPTRIERFDRLRRISSLATGLGVPNIYTMAERYKAEERWHQLHPLAVEVYEETRLRRFSAKIPDRPINGAGECFDLEKPFSPTICYEVSVSASLDFATMQRAIDILVANNELLQMRRTRDGFVPAPSSGNTAGMVRLFEYNEAEDLSEGDGRKRRIAIEIAAEMTPKPPKSLRAVLLPGPGSSCTLLLLGHRAIFDTRSIVLLSEDLFRIYEQLAGETDISLRPVQQTYLAFLEELHSKKAIDETVKKKAVVSDAEITVDGQVEFGSVTISIARSLAQRLTQYPFTGYGLQPAELFGLSLSRALEATGEAADIDVLVDYRGLKTDLEHTVGPLSFICSLPDLTGEGSVPMAISNLRNSLAAAAETRLSGKVDSNARSGPSAPVVILNTEYYTSPPWFGGYQWKPIGFAIGVNQPDHRYALQISPIRSYEGIRVCIKYRHTAIGKSLLAAVVRYLPSELETILNYCEGYDQARTFWLAELGQNLPQANLDLEFDGSAIEETTAIYKSGIREAVIERASSQLGLCRRTLILAAFGSLLSRLNGRENVSIFCCFVGDESSSAAPVLLSSQWDMSFSELTHQTNLKINSAARYGEYAAEILSRELDNFTEHNNSPVFDVGYQHFMGACHDQSDGLEDAVARFPVNCRGLNLTLRVIEDDNSVRVEFVYRSNCLSKSLVAELDSYLGNILKMVGEDPDIPLGNISLGYDQVINEVADSFSKTAFNF